MADDLESKDAFETVFEIPSPAKANTVKSRSVKTLKADRGAL